MKQLSLFQECTPPALDKKQSVSWKLFIDGASRKNPGLAGAGIYLLKNDMPFLKQGFFLGHKTNNQAEYLALVLGIFFSKKHVPQDETLYIFSDSELLIKQCKGEYTVKSDQLKQLFKIALKLLDNSSYSFCHILREFNTYADALANEGIDKKIAVPQECIRFLHDYDIEL